jgi:Mn-dependent DtxR family transcriptional regulator
MKTFPGSQVPLLFEQMNKVQEKETEKWDAKPFIFLVGGEEKEFFSIGQLGKALGNRSTVTLRKWEREGILPKSPYTKPSDDPRGRRRMYTRDMVEGLVKIAKEEGVWLPDKGRRLTETLFQQKAVNLFQKLLKK